MADVETADVRKKIGAIARPWSSRIGRRLAHRRREDGGIAALAVRSPTLRAGRQDMRNVSLRD